MHNFFRSIVRLVFGKLLPQFAYPVFRGPLQGARFILRSFSGEAGGVSVYFNAIEAEQTTALVNTLSKGQVFFDIGANVGYYTILGSRLVGAQGIVVAFEPVIRNLSYLYQHVLLNKAHNATIISAACSDAVSFVSFTSGNNYATGFLATEHSHQIASNKSTTIVPTITVDKVVQQLGVSPHVIKIDVEGAEFSVLKGAQSTLYETKPRIFLSVHSEVLKLACLEYLDGLGYTVEALDHGKNNPAEFLAIHTMNL